MDLGHEGADSGVHVLELLQRGVLHPGHLFVHVRLVRDRTRDGGHRRPLIDRVVHRQLELLDKGFRAVPESAEGHPDLLESAVGSEGHLDAPLGRLGQDRLRLPPRQSGPLRHRLAGPRELLRDLVFSEHSDLPRRTIPEES